MLAATLDWFIEDVLRLPVQKALDPNDPHDFAVICAQLAKATAGLAQADEAKALKAALANLDVDWKKMNAAAKAKVVEASKQALNPSKLVLPKIEEHFEANAVKLGIQTKGATKKTFGFHISPDLSAVQLSTLHAVALSQGNYVRDEYGKRSALFGMKAKQIVAEELAKGSPQKEIADRLHKELTAQQFNRSRAYWGVVANAFANRARTYTNLSSYQEVGIVAFRFEAIRDERTSHICRFMHGREFPVEAALGAFAASEKPGGDVKASQPWVSQTSDADGNPQLYIKDPDSGDRTTVATVTESAMGKVDESGKFHGADDATLQKLGIMTPPLHGHCRSSIVPIEAAHTVQVPQAFQLEPYEPPAPVKPAVSPFAEEQETLHAPAPPDDKQQQLMFGEGGIEMKPISIPIIAEPEAEPVKGMVPLHAKMGGAMEQLNALPVDSVGSVPNPAPVKSHPGFVSNGDKWAVIQQAIEDKVASKSFLKKIADIPSTAADVDKDKVAALLKSPKLLMQEKVTIVKDGKDYYVVEGHEALAAANLLKKWKLNVTEVHLKDAEKHYAAKAKEAALKPKAAPLPPAPVPPPKPPPPPPPAPLPAAKLTPEQIMHEVTNRPGGGSNGGKFYRGTDGEERFVKLYADSSQAHGEVLANSLYKALGFESPEATTWADKSGKQAYAAKLVAGKQLGTGCTKDQAREFFKGFAADVLCGNWDAAGASVDNAFLLPNGKVMRIDNGGAFLMRAQAGRKPDSVLNSVTELEYFFPNSGKSNPGYHAIAKAAGYESTKDFKDELKKQVDAITALREQFGGWNNFVAQYAPGMPAGADRDKIIKMLEERHKGLQKHVDKLFAPPPPPPPAYTKPKNFKLPPSSDSPNAANPYRAPPIEGVAPKKGVEIKDLPETEPPEGSLVHSPSYDKMPWGEKRSDYQARAKRNVEDKINRSQKAGIESFTGGGYTSIRDDEESGKPNERSKAIQEAYKVALPEPCTTYRGLKNLPAEVVQRWVEWTPDKGPFRLGRNEVPATSSSAWHAGVSVNHGLFMGGPEEPSAGSGYKVLLQIHQKSGIVVEKISSSGQQESEILLPKDAQFRVLQVARWKGRQRIVVIELEEV